MKVFDFTNGVKGKLLADIYRPSYMTGFLRNDAFYANKNKNYQFQFGAGSSFKGKDTPINVADFGVDAICFCLGQLSSGTEAGKWEWFCMYTEAGFQKALENGQVYIKSYQK